MIQTHDKLTLTILQTQEDKEKHGGYTYLIQESFSSHVAFRTEDGLNYWLKITGLKIGDQLDHLYHTFKIQGQYKTNCILGIDTWTGELFITDKKLIDIRSNLLDATKCDLNYNCAWMSNADYTKGFIEQTENGNIIYFLNPNEKQRIIYPYFAIKH